MPSKSLPCCEAALMPENLPLPRHLSQSEFQNDPPRGPRRAFQHSAVRNRSNLSSLRNRFLRVLPYKTASPANWNSSMKTILLAVNLVFLASFAAKANDLIHVTAHLNDEQIIGGLLHLDVATKQGHIDGSRNYPYFICTQEAGRTAAVGATAVNKASVQITRLIDGNVEVEATVTSVNKAKLTAAQTQCANSPLEANSASEKLVLSPSKAAEEFRLGGITIVIGGL